MISYVKKSIACIKAPTLIIHAEEDDVASPRNARFVAENIGSKIVESIFLHNSYHMITVDNEREQVSSDTIRFFKGVLSNHDST
jgi:carboxylesterase